MEIPLYYCFLSSHFCGAGYTFEVYVLSSEVTQEEGHLLHLLPAVLVFVFIATRGPAQLSFVSTRLFFYAQPSRTLGRVHELDGSVSSAFQIRWDSAITNLTEKKRDAHTSDPPSRVAKEAAPQAEAKRSLYLFSQYAPSGLPKSAAVHFQNTTTVRLALQSLLAHPTRLTDPYPFQLLS